MANKKKLVATPLTRTIWWATVNESKGMIIGDNKIDVTDNAIESVLDHFILDNNFKEKGFSGYAYKKKDGNEVTICGFDERHLAIDSKLWKETKAKAEEFDRLKSTLEDLVKLYSELCEKTEKETLTLEYRLLENFIAYMPNTYRKRNCNWVVVKDFLQFGTSRGGRTSSIEKCLLLGIDPDSYTLKQKEVE